MLQQVYKIKGFTEALFGIPSFKEISPITPEKRRK